MGQKLEKCRLDLLKDMLEQQDPQYIDSRLANQCKVSELPLFFPEGPFGTPLYSTTSHNSGYGSQADIRKFASRFK